MNTIEIKVNVDTAPIDSLIAKLERAVELQKQLNHQPGEDPAALAKALRSAEENISLLNNRNSFIR
ncbi:hypothetical protein [Yersinia similis]|uniref:hypothetical protein n=1 Tax=Yersinia similis TaxID=367190 RepID=UPI00119FFEA4|nr:hypothetical protein [Yersinia similis]